MDDGSCLIGGCTDSHHPGFEPEATFSAGTCLVHAGCTDSTAAYYRSIANVDDGSCIYAGCTNSDAVDYSPVATVPTACTAAVLGCTDPTATNYRSAANRDDGGCVRPGCTDALAPNYSPAATFDDRSCAIYQLGCMTRAALNYRSIATVDDGSCVVVEPPSPPPTPPSAPPFAPCPSSFSFELQWQADGLNQAQVRPSPWLPSQALHLGFPSCPSCTVLGVTKGDAQLLSADAGTGAVFLLSASPTRDNFEFLFSGSFAEGASATAVVNCVQAPPSADRKSVV